MMKSEVCSVSAPSFLGALQRMTFRADERSAVQRKWKEARDAKHAEKIAELNKLKAEGWISESRIRDNGNDFIVLSKSGKRTTVNFLA
jgi:hypothetical protein